MRAEPPTKAAGGKGEEPTLEEEESKAKELAEAAKETAKLEAAKAAEAKAAADAAKAAADAKAAQDKADEIKRNTRPDGTIWVDGKRMFPDGSAVNGVNIL